MENQGGVLIKGIQDGLLITPQPGLWIEQSRDVFAVIDEKQSFFKGALIYIDIGETILKVKEITAIRDHFLDQSITLKGIISTSDKTIDNCKSLGLETNLQEKKEIKPISAQDDSGENAVFICRTLRAGYRVNAREHIIIKGDVNPGAEIISEGNIIVWGKLLGSVIAGVNGKDGAFVCALELRPTQLRIGDYVFPPFQKKGKIFPEIAMIKNNQFNIEIWNKEKG